jgi:FLVCR family feline leukemia virus subgroup C receptor-related protein
MATTVMVNILTLGNAVGPFLPQWFINENAENSEALSEMVNMFYYDAIWGSVLFVFVLIFFKSKPPTPPSNAATITRHNYCGSMAKLCKNGNYMLALVA